MKEKKTRSGLRLLLTFEKVTSVDKSIKGTTGAGCEGGGGSPLTPKGEKLG